MEQGFSDRVLKATAYLEGIDLPAVPKPRSRAKAGVEASLAKTREQAMVVGADIVSFVSGTDPRLRNAIIQSALLAQLAATRIVADRNDIRAWYEAYFDVLTQLGWAIQERAFSEHREGGADFEAHRAILSVASTVLGGATAAFQVVQATLNAMSEASKGTWLTVFRQESERGHAARFQVTVVEPASQKGAVIGLMAFDLQARVSLTQVLFAKFRAMDVTFRHASGQLSIDVELLSEVAPAIAQRVGGFVKTYVEAIEI